MAEVCDREARLSAIVGTAVDAIIRFDTNGIIGVGREVLARRKDGTSIPVELAVSKMQIGDKTMFTGILRDVSERKKIEHMKSEFIATVSHELRTPLTSIRGSLGLLAGGAMGELSEQASEVVEIAMNNSCRLVRLVNEFLDIEKIESGRLEFRLARVDLSQAVQEAIENIRGLALEKAVRVVAKGEVSEHESELTDRVYASLFTKRPDAAESRTSCWAWGLPSFSSSSSTSWK